jgi:hypothetical protein
MSSSRAAAGEQQQFRYFRDGAVDETSKKAAMASGISASAAGSGAVRVREPTGLAAAASQAAAQQQPKKPKGQPHAATATTAAAATPAPAAAGKHVKALPAFSSLQTVSTLWSCYSKGCNGSQPWELLEQQGPGWRLGERKSWCELKKVIDEVKYVAVQNSKSYEWAAQQLDEEMAQGKHSIGKFIKEVVGARVTQRQKAAAEAAAAEAAAAAEGQQQS